jgi:hypothetical protein
MMNTARPSEEHMNRNGGNTVVALKLMEDDLVARLSLHLRVSGNGGSDHSKEVSSLNNNKHGHGCGRGRGSGGCGAGSHDSGDNAGDRGGKSFGHDNGGTSGNITNDECHY